VLRNPRTGRWLVLSRRVRTIRARSLSEVVPALRAVAQAVEQEKLFAAGYVAYEAAPAFDAALRVHAPDPFPLLAFDLYRTASETDALPAGRAVMPPTAPWHPDITPEEYGRSFRTIRAAIRAGDTYQVNYTHRLHAPAVRDPWGLFTALVGDEPPPYAAFLDLGAWQVCSASPELFFRLEGDRLETRPMKGTAARGRWPAEDRRRAAELRRSVKNRAENVMIVDMARHDLSRIAVTGSVRADPLFTVERYPTLWQMISTVQCRTRAPLDKIFEALFPAASITGAPKTRTMAIIRAVEPSPRHVYCGAIGFLAPGRCAQFSVAIRTVLVDRRRGRMEYGVGGGIVWDSRCRREEAECAVKVRVLQPQPQPFELLETLRWTPGEGIWLLDEHLRRLRGSIAYFGFRVDVRHVQDELNDFVAKLAAGCGASGGRALPLESAPVPPAPQRLRLLVARDGGVRIEAAPLPAAAPGSITVAADPVDETNPFLFHKTTRRDVYAGALRQRPGSTDVLLWNRRGEVTESTIANVLVTINGRLCTPPLRCGLLPGTARADLLRRGEVRERVITLDELRRSPAIYLVNSVRGRWPVRLAAG
jgi:para-aminobenzoate synthetase/4-amino-4-deoxychorismate lyase